MQLRVSSIGSDYPKDVFLKTPIGEIFYALESVKYYEQLNANVASTTTANLLQTVYSIALGMSGSKTKNTNKTSDYLPFPFWKPKTAVATGPSLVTQSTLERLASEGRLPMHIFCQLIVRGD